MFARVHDADVFVDRLTHPTQQGLQRHTFFNLVRMQRLGILAQRQARVRGRVRLDVFWRADADDFAAGVAALGAEIDNPVGGSHHVEVVLDDDHRVPGSEQLAQRAHELGDVVEVQAGGWLIKQEQGAFAGDCLARAR